MPIVEVDTVVIFRFDLDVLVHDIRLWYDIAWSWHIHHFLKYDCFRLSIWQLPNQPNTSISGCNQCDPIESLHLLFILNRIGVGDKHWLAAGDVSCASTINDPITGWSCCAGNHAIVLDWCGESPSGGSCSWCFCSSVGRLWRIATLLAHAVLGGVDSALRMRALSQILPFPVIVSLIICRFAPWTVAASTGYTAITNRSTFATLHCNEPSWWSKPILSLHGNFLLDELGDNLIGRGVHRGICVHH